MHGLLDLSRGLSFYDLRNWSSFISVHAYRIVDIISMLHTSIQLNSVNSNLWIFINITNIFFVSIILNDENIVIRFHFKISTLTCRMSINTIIQIKHYLLIYKRRNTWSVEYFFVSFYHNLTLQKVPVAHKNLCF